MMKRMRALCALFPLCILAGCGGPSEADIAKIFGNANKVFGGSGKVTVEEVNCVQAVGKPGYTCNFLLDGRPMESDFIQRNDGWHSNN